MTLQSGAITAEISGALMPKSDKEVGSPPDKGELEGVWVSNLCCFTLTWFTLGTCFTNGRTRFFSECKCMEAQNEQPHVVEIKRTRIPAG